MSSIPRHLDPKFPQAQRQPSRDSLRSLAHSHMSQASDGQYHDDAFEDFDRLPSSPARLDIDLPESNLDLTIDFNTILAESRSAPAPAEEKVEMDKVQKRASNVMKLAEQNERLKAELRAMTERLEAAERRQRELAQAQAQAQAAQGKGTAGSQLGGEGASGSAH
ncbi:hypothetical protein C8Q79DRAFT_1009235 [Trametes meyenii]|nr:hypothetical protein C8Q79DRAFT_1009235 [Trametes meyenii]